MRGLVFAFFVAASTVLAQGPPTGTVFENIKTLNQKQDIPGAQYPNGMNTYHISIVNQYADADLAQILSGPGPYTFFAPSDHSFNRLQGSDPAYYARIMSDPSLMRTTLQYLITPQRYDLFSAPPHSTLPSFLAPATLDATIMPNDPAKNPVGWVPAFIGVADTPGDVKATVVHTIDSTNGILYVVDTILRPPAAAVAGAPAPPGSNSTTVVVFTISATVSAASASSVSASPSSAMLVSTTTSATVAVTPISTTAAPAATPTSTAADPASATPALAPSPSGPVGLDTVPKSGGAPSARPRIALGMLVAAAAAVFAF